MMIELPFFSICIPAHNSLPLIKETIASISKQTFTDWEVRIVDDCSEDGTVEWLHSQNVILHDHLHVVSLDANRGPFYARRVAFRAARGRYVLCIDSDDGLVDEGALGRLHDTIVGVDASPDIVLFNATIDGTKRTSWVDYAAEGIHPGEVDKKLAIEVFLKTHKLNNLCLKAIKRDLLLPAVLEGAQGLLMCEDRLEVAGVLAKASCILLLDEPLYYYRQNDASTTHGTFKLDYFLQQSYVESTIAELFAGYAALGGQQRQFLMLCADDMLRVVRGRTVREAADFYKHIRNDAFFAGAYLSEGVVGQRGDHAALLRLLSAGRYSMAVLAAKCLSAFKACIKGFQGRP